MAGDGSILLIVNELDLIVNVLCEAFGGGSYLQPAHRFEALKEY